MLYEYTLVIGGIDNFTSPIEAIKAGDPVHSPVQITTMK